MLSRRVGSSEYYFILCISWWGDRCTELIGKYIDRTVCRYSHKKLHGFCVCVYMKWSTFPSAHMKDFSYDYINFLQHLIHESPSGMYVVNVILSHNSPNENCISDSRLIMVPFLPITCLLCHSRYVAIIACASLLNGCFLHLSLSVSQCGHQSLESCHHLAPAMFMPSMMSWFGLRSVN
jgi:hypothetical protein